MKHLTFLLLLLIGYHTYSQTIHEVNVVVGQPEECVITAVASAEFDISVFPNPASQSLSINSEFNIEKITIVDVTGQTIYSKIVHGSQFNLDVSKYRKGMYQCVIKHSKGTQVRKFILQ